MSDSWGIWGLKMAIRVSAMALLDPVIPGSGVMMGGMIAGTVDVAFGFAVDAAIDAAVDTAVDSAVDVAVNKAVDGTIDATVSAAVDATVDSFVNATMDATVDSTLHVTTNSLAEASVCGPLDASLDLAMSGPVDATLQVNFDGAVNITPETVSTFAARSGIKYAAGKVTDAGVDAAVATLQQRPSGNASRTSTTGSRRTVITHETSSHPGPNGQPVAFNTLQHRTLTATAKTEHSYLQWVVVSCMLTLLAAVFSGHLTASHMTK